MKIEYDLDKRNKTLQERGLDFDLAIDVFAGHHFTLQDLRQPDEMRYISVGLLSARMVVIVWTPRGDTRRIISMRKANEREIERYRERLG